MLILFLSLSLSFADHIPNNIQTNPWAKVKVPTQTSSESVGSYSAGCLRGARDLEKDGLGYQAVRLSRHRYFGHPSMLTFLKVLSSQTFAQSLGTLLVADIGQPRGGPTLTGHLSHQSGLDVDIWFAQPPKGKVLTDQERETFPATSMLNKEGTQMDLTQWSPNKEDILRATSEQPEVERILVNPVIKKFLCDKYAGQMWLRKLRPWWGHDDHLHVRLKCPPGSSLCESQAPVPPGDGCDSSLDWWFSQEAKDEWERIKNDKTPRKMPHLPKECEKILVEPPTTKHRS